MANSLFGVSVPSLNGARLLEIVFSIVLLGMVSGCDQKTQTQSPTTAPSMIAQCPASGTVCYVRDDVGISGLAQINATTYLTVHDAHGGPSEADNDRLGIISLSGSSGRFDYVAVKVGKDEWNGNDKEIASDLESVCKLSEEDNEFLVAESGRADVFRGGKSPFTNAHQGRIFHVKLDQSTTPGAPRATVLKTPNLKLFAVTPPTPVVLPSGERKPVHSRENYEGLACIYLNSDANGNANYLVILGERGGDPTLEATLYWGEYKTGPAAAARKIDWLTTNKVTGIIAPPAGARTNKKKWRDITGLHIDQDGILWATAAFDTDVDLPPYKGAVYKLGYVCVSAARDQHGQTCDYMQAPRPILFSPFVTLANFSWHKPEGVAAPADQRPAQGSVSVGTEDEDAGGAWWPDFP